MIDGRLLLILALGMFFVPFTAEGQQAGRTHRIGILHEGYLPNVPQVEGLKAGLKAAGFEEGRNATLEIRVTRGNPDAAPSAAADLVAAAPDVIFTSGEGPTQAVRMATREIPIEHPSSGTRGSGRDTLARKFDVSCIYKSPVL